MNFILYMPEALREESLACYGHPLVRTPNVDRLMDTSNVSSWEENPRVTPTR